MIRLLKARAAADEGGQILVMVGLGMVAFIAAVGLVIDIGFALAANRRAQNGVDAAAHAGAIVIVKEIASDTTTENDANVLSAIEDAATANEIDFDEAWYTDWQGNQLVPPVEVGSLGTGAIPAGAQGVVVDGTLTHTTFFAQLIGIAELNATGEATAVGGPASEPCPGTEACAFVPITFPTTVVTCDGQNKSVPAEDAGGNPYEWSENTRYIIPLCGNNPGSVGWLDWYAPQGGISELAAEICDPNPPELNLPDWFEVTSTGNVNAQNVEDCLNKYAGQYILMPMFDDTCRVNPGEGNPCTQPAATGQNQWYHFPSYAVFQLDSPKGAYVNGNNSTACAGAGGNGATTCLIGRFVDAVGGGSVGPVGPGANTPSSFYAVQLIR
jgi:hypothetical protein